MASRFHIPKPVETTPTFSNVSPRFVSERLSVVHCAFRRTPAFGRPQALELFRHDGKWPKQREMPALLLAICGLALLLRRPHERDDSLRDLENLTKAPKIPGPREST